MSDKPISVICPHCYRRVRGKPAWMGRQARCKCGDTFRVTEACCAERTFDNLAGLKVNVALFISVYDVVLKTMDAGGGVRDFRLAVQPVPRRGGWTGDDPWHANIVFRQTTAMLYNTRHNQEMEEGEVSHWRLKGLHTSCPICAPLLEKVFSVDDRRFYPPLHIGCDCQTSMVFAARELREARRKGQLVEPSDDIEGACPWPPPPASRDIDQTSVCYHWAEFARRCGWELTSDPDAVDEED